MVLGGTKTSAISNPASLAGPQILNTIYSHAAKPVEAVRKEVPKKFPVMVGWGGGS